jgi:hypothetical protein
MLNRDLMLPSGVKSCRSGIAHREQRWVTKLRSGLGNGHANVKVWQDIYVIQVPVKVKVPANWTKTGGTKVLRNIYRRLHVS